MVIASERVQDLGPTPSLVVDLPTVERNIARLAAYASGHRLGIRPHTKTHKSVAMATRQIAPARSA